MYKFSKIGVIILYPLISLIFPILGFAIIGTQLATNNSLDGGSISSLVNVGTLFSLVLIVLALIYSYQAYKQHLFKKQPDGTRLAKTSDWFAAIFSALVIAGFLQNLLKLIA